MSDIDAALDAIDSGVAPADLETDDLEFKTQDPSLKRCLEILADAVVCQANAVGGSILVGVDDKVAGPAAFRGVGDELTVDSVARGIFDRTRPPLSVPIRDTEHKGVRLLVISVPRGAVFYANAKGTATRRVGSECRPFPPEEQRQALSSRGMYDWSAQPCGASGDIVDPDELGRLRRLLRAAGKDDLAKLDEVALFESLRLVTRHGELTNAALVLLGTERALRAVVPSYGYAYQYRSSPGAESTTRFRESRPLLVAVERLIDAIGDRRTVHSLNVDGGVQLQLPDYPAAAVRELVVNALVHRDYAIEGAVDVEHTPDQLIVNSPGGLVFGVTPDNILSHPSTPRNRLLLETVTLLQLAERTGQGVDRAYREMLRAGKPPPSFVDDSLRVGATLSGGAGNDAFVRFLTSALDPELGRDLEVLLSLDLLRSQRNITADRLAPRIQRSPANAQRTLELLVDVGMIEPSARTSRKPFPTYSLTSTALVDMGRAVTYHRPRPEGADAKVVEHVQEYGFITNQTLRRLFDLGVYPARDMLRQLQDRGLLVKLDEQRAGPGVRYGPGPSFPRREQRPVRR